MNSGRAKSLRTKDSNLEYRKYNKQTFHHRYNGLDNQGNKTFVEITDPIKLDDCERLAYKVAKNDYKNNHKR